MIIKKMTATFGCLDKAEMELHEGLNIVSAPNESGKSTWCGFIRAMLYGIDSAQREKGGVKPDKVKYAPWSGESMSGEMEIEHEGKDITLRRSTKTATAPMREFSAVYSGTAQAVPALKGTDAGLNLTGMPKAVFESSVFVRQAGLAVSNNPELEKRINTIISTGEDDAVSYTDADSLLRAWLRKRRHNRSGAIPVIDSRIAEKQEALDAMSDSVQELAALDARLRSSLAREKQAAEESAAVAEKRRNYMMERVELLRTSAAEAEQAAIAAREKSRLIAKGPGETVFRGMTPEESLRRVKVVGEYFQQLDDSAISPVSALIVAGVAIVLFILKFTLGEIYEIMHIAGIVGVFLFLAGAVGVAISNSKKKEIAQKKADLLKKWQVSSYEELVANVETYAAAFGNADEAKAQLEAAEAELSRCRSALRKAEEELISSVPGEDPALASARAESADLRRRIAITQGKLEAMGDPMVSATELEALQARRTELADDYEAISLAIDALRDANDEMQQRFSPALGRRATEIMSRLTGGKYSQLSFDRELDATAKRSGDTLPHEEAFLSEGTADQLYLALRLAICELALPEGCSCPLILDDALVNFDDERMGYALEVLKEISEKRQVILFTCHEREKEYLAKQ